MAYLALLRVGVSMSLLLWSAGRDPALAQSEYPAKPTRMIVNQAPGGVADLVCREAAEVLSAKLGQPFVVENRVGASGVIGSRAVATAAPDGHTLLCTSSSITTEAALRPSENFDPLRHLTAVSLLTKAFWGIYVSPEVPAQSLKEVIDIAQKNPGTVKYASAGSGGSVHLVTEWLARAVGISLIHVPYKSASDMLLSLSRNETHLVLVDQSQARPFVESGKVKLLALALDQRLPYYPNVPTVLESGISNFNPVIWQGILAPAGTNPSVITKLGNVLRNHFTSAEAKKRHEDRGSMADWEGAEDLGRRMQAEIVEWKKVISQAGITPE